MTVSYIPKGYHTATPYLMVRGATEAIEFYQRAFGAELMMQLVQSNGKVGHAEIRVGDSVIMLADEMPEMKMFGPQSLGGAGVSMVLYVEDADASFKRALEAGAKELKPVQDQFYGDRSGTLSDPYGHTWSIATHLQDLSPEELNQRFEQFMREYENS